MNPRCEPKFRNNAKEGTTHEVPRSLRYGRGFPYHGRSARLRGDEAKVDTGDAAWMLVSTALVLMMTVPGVALFYAAWCARRMCSPP
jgi:hypothetical protein